MALTSFPRTINEKAARVVAGVVAVTAAVALATGARWLAVPLAYGFWARVLTGPRLSPLALVASRVVAPRLGPAKVVAGPPKRFAQAIGAALTSAAVVALALGLQLVVDALLAVLLAAATLESVFALCLGCGIFAVLMRAGMIPAAICAECADLSARRPA
ncbi:MAG TPA: DUF4395 domain-containing protein [Solirubrobacteraceae bacterium]|nr:DUF4395 domain-containing protein [Solirubrobacteraceae bacterium]